MLASIVQMMDRNKKPEMQLAAVRCVTYLFRYQHFCSCHCVEIVKIGALKPDMVMDLYITMVGRVKVKVIFLTIFDLRGHLRPL